jgi:hypothetical protein
MGSSEMLKNYKNLKVWQKSYELYLEIYDDSKIPKGRKIRTDLSKIERMLKALIKSLENKPLNP